MDPIPEIPEDLRDSPDETILRAQVKCWRCGQTVVPSHAGKCPECAAKVAEALASSEPAAAKEARWEESNDAASIKRMLWFYVVLLCTTVFFSWSVQGMIPDDVTSLTRAETVRILIAMAVVSAIDAGIVLAALFSIRRLIDLPTHTKPVGLLRGWAIAIPVLAVVLGINFAYHWFIFELAGIKPEEDLLLGYRSLLPFVIILYCVMPAIFEEIFFRHVCLGVLRRHVDIHTAVFVSSMMFGLCHIGVLASAPILAVVGAGFAYVRIFTGSLLIPIVLHFLHNLIIVLMETP